MSLLFEGFLAILMVALIVYCIKLNQRLSMLRDQNAQFADMMTGLGEASERVEQSVRHLRAAGLAAEKSLRAVIQDAAVVQQDLSRLVGQPSRSATPRLSQPKPHQPFPTTAAESTKDAAAGGHTKQVERDILMDASPSGTVDHKQPPRPQTRAEAEETVLQAIRTARVGI